MDARATIAAIRQGRAPGTDRITAFANGLADGSVSDAQAGAFAMAVCLQGLDEAHRVALTTAMRDSGDVLRWDVGTPVLDKHSTGGVGDCVSLILAPMLAACGVAVPMISGRGLGHTGGTLDKLEAIPGVATDVSEARLRAIVADVGCAIVGATGRIAPADRRLYAVRDVTATVDSVDLITASILSKKLAAGLDALVLDVKVGSGAFMKSREAATALARALVDTAKGAGCPTVAVLSDMNQPLAPALGNAVEVAVCMEVLSGQSDAAPRLVALAVELGCIALGLAGWPEAKARAALVRTLADGSALNRFARMIAALGGPPDMHLDWRTHLPQAPVMLPVVASTAGHIAAIDGEALGLAVVGLGGGRAREGDRIDPAVGLTAIPELGTPVAVGDPLAIVHARTPQAAEAARTAVLAAITLGGPVPVPALIIDRIT
ncbi:thymidine phosphorylase [Loktanella fryxellensis]|uniref:Thymidine phosphorylase n=1 Tax=Loktanella fryxellensis TaxID=245187 RepID=A0A1H7YST3_9RHOB|nr:thymidine phosphorylase [Loktanella fryxellensis]SEM48944.1 thymidine phosphorylase [Loktanella fryxellensis]